MKHAKRIGLQSDYIEDSETNRIIRQFIALPLLPEEHILSNFERIRTHIPQFIKTLEYGRLYHKSMAEQ